MRRRNKKAIHLTAGLMAAAMVSTSVVPYAGVNVYGAVKEDGVSVTEDTEETVDDEKVVKDTKAEGKNAQADNDAEITAEVDSSDEAELKNENFDVKIGKHGEISSLKINDGFDTDYVMNAQNAKAQNTSGHQWMGELMFATKKAGDSKWRDERTSNSEKIRTITKSEDGKSVKVEYKADNSDASEKVINDMNVTEEYKLEDNELTWNITLENPGSEDLIVGDLGLPMPFNEYWTAGDQIYETRTVDHSFVAQNSSYIYAQRPSGEGKFILFTPDTETGASLEYQDHWRTQERESYETAWCQDQSGWQNGLNVFYVYSDQIKKTARGYLPHTSLKLKKGEKKTLTFRFQTVENEKDMKSKLYENGLVDAVAVPGMTFSKNMPAKMYLHTKYDKDDISIDIKCPHDLNLYGEQDKAQATVTEMEHTASALNTYATFDKKVEIDGEQYLVYDLKFDELGQHNAVITYDKGKKKTTLQFYIMDSVDGALETHSDFMVEKTQLDLPGEVGDKVFDDWMMDKKTTRNNTENDYFGMSYWGWGDDWGLTHGTYLAAKNVYQPVSKQIQAVDDYLDTAIWNGLMQEHHNDYLIHDFLVREPNPSPIYRGYAYPHIYNTYFMMYEIESRYPEMIKYKETADTYLLRAYNILKAYYGDQVAYNWGTGTMGEFTTPAIISALRKEGYDTEAENVVNIMSRKYQSFKDQKYPYGSEYSYDNTGEEAVYTLAKMQKAAGIDEENAERMMRAINTKTRACRGTQPVWYEYSVPVTNCGENWWQFQYSMALIGGCMDDWLRNQDNDYDDVSKAEAERMNYAAKLGNLTCINSGQIDSQEENIGAVAWTYQAELGNLGGQGTGGGTLHNGWRQMSGESDLGLFGALEILSSDVSEDPVFGLFGYGCDATEKDGVYTVKPLDGLYTRLNFINTGLSIELQRDQYTKAVYDKNSASLKLSMKNLEKTAHTSDIELNGLEKGSYALYVNDKRQGGFTVNSHSILVPVKLPAEASAEVEIKKESAQDGEVTLDAGKDMTVALSDSWKLSGTAENTEKLGTTLDVTWECIGKPEGAEVTIVTPNNLRSYVNLNKTGAYEFTLTSGDVSDTVKVTVTEDTELPEKVAGYTFDKLNSGKTIAENEVEDGAGARLVGSPTIGEGKASADGTVSNGIEIKGSNTNGYVRLPESLTKRVSKATIAADVKLNGSQPDGASLFTFADGKNTIAVRFRDGYELALVNGKDEKRTGISLAEGYWKNIAVTLDGQDMILYIDGLKKFTWSGASVVPADLSTASRSDYLGRGREQSDAFLKGTIDNFDFYSVSLDEDELTKLYGTGETAVPEDAEAGNVVTKAGVAPVLPEKISVLYSNGIYESGEVIWDSVPEESYANAGKFTVKGKVKGSDIETSVTVIVTDGELANIAGSASITGSYENPADLGGYATMNDGFEPASSADTSHGTWHNWGGANTQSAWVAYSWSDEQIIDSIDAYYFRDGNGNFAPKSVELYYLDTDGKTWKSVRNAKGLGTALNKYNKTTFDPVVTKGLKMVLTPASQGCGVIEWKAYGYVEKEKSDKTELRRIVNAFAAIDKTKCSNYDGMEELAAEGAELAKNRAASQEEVDAEVKKLEKFYKGIVPNDGNFAYKASLAASYTSSWESLPSLKDGKLPDSSSSSRYAHWGTWGHGKKSETITYTWGTPIAMDESRLYVWTDNDEWNAGDGIDFPKTITSRYENEDGEWVDGPTLDESQITMDGWTVISMNGVPVRAIELTLNMYDESYGGVGAHEWQITGKEIEETEPENPDQPDDPTPTPDDPEPQPENPDEPENPDQPEKPDQPQNPAQPEIHVPAAPAKGVITSDMTEALLLGVKGNNFSFEAGSKAKYSLDKASSKIVKVSKSGKVTIKKTGTAVVKVTEKNGSEKSVTLYAEKPKAEKVKSNGFNELTVNDLVSGLLYSKPDKVVSKDTKKVTVDPATGKLTALGNGSAKIDVYFGKVKLTAKVTVKMPKLSHTKKSLKAGQSYQLKLRNAGDLKAQWTSSDTSIATVDENGKITAVKSGKAVIKAVVSGKEVGSCTITVK